MIRKYLRRAFGVIILLVPVIAYMMGRKDADADRDADSLKASNDAKDNRYELENTDDQRLVDILTGKLHER